MFSLSVSAMENYFRPGTVWTTSKMAYSSELPIYFVNTYYTILPVTDFQGEKILPFASYTEEDQKPKIVRYLRTEGDKVFMRRIEPEYPDWYLLYDFGLEVGDEVDIYDFILKIDENGERIETAIPIRLKCLKRDFYLNDDETSAPLMRLQCLERDGDDYSQLTECQGDWIIGMGYLKGSGNLLYPWCWGWDGTSSRTICVESPKGNVVFGEPVAGVKSVSETANTATEGIYKLQGVRVADSTDNLPVGLYISKGKKIAVTK